jgi:hypothetical protein
MAQASLAGHLIWGSGTNRYAVYCIDVMYKSSSYRIYRRYRTFHTLHQAVRFHHDLLIILSHLIGSQLTVKFPEEMAPLQEIFPEKGSLGSLVNSFDAVTNERSLRLQQYLQEVLSHEKVKTDEMMLSFLDVANQGSLLSPTPLLSDLTFILRCFWVQKVCRLYTSAERDLYAS